MISQLFIVPTTIPTTRTTPTQTTTRAHTFASFEFNVGLMQLSHEFPSVAVRLAEPVPTLPTIFVSDWRHLSTPPAAYDALLARWTHDAAHTIQVAGEPVQATALTALEILTRYQAFVQRKNAASMNVLLLRALEYHRALYDLSQPRIADDYVHALDTWQWTLRLRGGASFEVQLAALFHDIERLTRARDAITELLGANDDARAMHAADSATMTRRYLSELGIERALLERVAILITEHEAPSDDAEVRLLADADALSFISWRLAPYLDHHGRDMAAERLGQELERMHLSNLPRLKCIRHRADVERLLVHVLCSRHRRERLAS